MYNNSNDPNLNSGSPPHSFTGTLILGNLFELQSTLIYFLPFSGQFEIENVISNMNFVIITNKCSLKENKSK